MEACTPIEFESGKHAAEAASNWILREAEADRIMESWERDLDTQALENDHTPEAIAHASESTQALEYDRTPEATAHASESPPALVDNLISCLCACFLQ